MRPIEQRTDISFAQALKCVEFRIPTSLEVPPAVLELAIGLRYSLIGIAAAHNVLIECPENELQELIGQLRSFGSLAKSHVGGAAISKLPYPAPLDLPDRVSEVFSNLFERYLSLFRRMCPLDLCLSILIDEFTQSHRQQIRAKSRFFGNRRVRSDFQFESDSSYNFALGFFERRRLDLDEVREIALLGE